MSHQLEEILNAGVEAGAAPGVVATIVDREGVRWEGAAGERAAGSGSAMTTDTVGAIFSMTKAVTGVAAMQLVEQGRMSLDAPASAVIPWFGETQVLEGFDANGDPITRPPASPITLRKLLTHTSGFTYELFNTNDIAWRQKTATPSMFTAENKALRVPLAFDPGTRWEYGIGIDWVGKMIEAISGQTLGEYFAANITGPLAMADTAFEPNESMLARAATIHARGPDGSLTPLELAPPENPEFQMGGGGLHGTMGDYGRFIRMFLNDGELDGQRILAPKTIDHMVQNSIGTTAIGGLKSALPMFTNDADMLAGEPKSWGLTFLINEGPLATGRSAGSLMWAGLANSYYWIDRSRGIGGAYLSQIFPFADEKSMGLFAEVESEAYRAFSR
ncbi:MAG: serine hydrolase domain-containing protein [Pseudomonadota bacterium]